MYLVVDGLVLLARDGLGFGFTRDYFTLRGVYPLLGTLVEGVSCRWDLLMMAYYWPHIIEVVEQYVWTYLCANKTK